MSLQVCTVALKCKNSTTIRQKQERSSLRCCFRQRRRHYFVDAPFKLKAIWWLHIFILKGWRKTSRNGKCCTPAATRPENRLQNWITGFMQQSWHSPWWCGRGCWGGAAAEACSGSVCGSWGWSSSGGNCEEHLWAKANTRNHDCSSKITSRSIKSISVEH